MSDESSSSIKESSEQAADVQQEESQLTAETEAIVEQVQGNVGDQAKSTGSDVIPDQNTQPQQRPPEDSSGIRESQESPVSSNDTSSGSQETWETGQSNSTELQASWATCDGSGTDSQQSCATRGLSLENTASNSGMESTQGCDNVTESQQSCATSGLSLENTASNSGMESTQGCDNVTEAPQAGDTCSDGESQQSSLISAAVEQTAQSASSLGSSSIDSGEVSDEESRLLGEIDADERNAQTSVSSTSNYSGDSRETALVCDSTTVESQDTGYLNGVSNDPDSPEIPDDGVERNGTSTRREVRGDQFFDRCVYLWNFLQNLSRLIRRSKSFLYFQVFLLVIPISEILVGVKHASLCPVIDSLPPIVVIHGIVGCFYVFSILGLATRRLLCPIIDKDCFTALLNVCRFLLVVLCIAGMRMLYAVTQLFDPSDPDTYCNIVFYYFTYCTYNLYIILFVLFLFIYIPTYRETIDGYERI